MWYNQSRLIVALVSIGSVFPAVAQQSVRLDCPQGTVQRGTKASNSMGSFCVKAVAQEGVQFKMHGPYVDFWPNGQKQSEGTYKDGIQVGKWIFWNAEGVKTSEIDFVDGSYHGKRIEFFPSGKQRLVEEYSKGKRNGVVQEFAEDGKVVRQAKYLDDRQVAVK